MIPLSMIMTMTTCGACLTIAVMVNMTGLCLVHKHPLLLTMSTRMRPIPRSCNSFYPSLSQTPPIRLINLSSLRTQWNIRTQRPGTLMCFQIIFLPKLIYFKFFFGLVIPSIYLTKVSTGLSTIPISLWETCGSSTGSNHKKTYCVDLHRLQNGWFQAGNRGGHVSW